MRAHRGTMLGRVSSGLLSSGLLLAVFSGCAVQTAKPPSMPTLKPPMAAVHAHAIESPNGTRNDNYYWLRDDKRTQPEVLAYLDAENAYTAAMTARTKPLETTIYDEIVGRTRQDDSSVPARYRHYWYYTRFQQGGEYPLYARRHGKPDAAEEVLLDEPAMAQGHGFFSIAAREISPNEKLLAWSEDDVGRRQFVVHVKDLASGKLLSDEIKGTSGSIAWADDDKTLFYVENDPETLLTVRVKKHVLGTDAAKDVVVHEESDHSYYINVRRSSDDHFVLIEEDSTLSTEMRFVRADKPTTKFRVFAPRERELEYHADHTGSRWVVRSNLDAKNFRLQQVDDGAVGDKRHWKDVVKGSDDVFINDFALFKRYLVISERNGGLLRLRIHPWNGKAETFVKSDEPAYVTTLGDNREQDTDILRYDYASLTTPTTIYDIDMRSGKRELKKRDAVLGDFDPANYVTERLWAPARDGTRIPVSLVHRADVKKDGSAPMLQYGYGSYGISTDPYFSAARLSLLDRGFVFAIAHVRGGQELGRTWYENGKLRNKRNTFTDFIDVTEFLVREGYAAKDKVFAQGGSAGGLLMGAVANMAPQDYRGIVANVPFVDVVTTMLDESIPLTTNEFDEWGNPKQADAYATMMAYSPYDNVTAQAYPAMLVTTGLWDSQVQYYEPAKWVAKLRATKTDQQPLLLKVNMEAGHGGRSGRFQRDRETAEVYAFILGQLDTPQVAAAPVTAPGKQKKK
jgi:oligopeptidase B